MRFRIDTHLKLPTWMPAALRLRSGGVRQRVSYIIGGILLLMIAAGCDDSIGPMPEPERPFTLYGYLNPRSDTQAVRIFAVAARLERESPDPIDADLYSIDAETGEVHRWRDSVVQIAQGDYRHVYWAAFRPAYERAYRIEVRRSDGEMSWAELTTPPDGESELLEAEILPGTQVMRQAVRWKNAPLIHDPQVHYHRHFLSGNRIVGRDTVSISYIKGKKRLSDGWEVVVDYRKDAADVKAPSSRFKGTPQLASVEVSVLVADSAWLPPGGIFDADDLVLAGRFSNVWNGYGFVGGGYPASIGWIPDEEILQRMGISPGQR